MNVIEYQNLFDLASQEDGTIFSVFAWSMVNGIPITSELSPGQLLIKPNSIYKDNDVTNYFKGKNQLIATGLTKEQIEDIDSIGIGKMAIGSTFIIR